MGLGDPPPQSWVSDGWAPAQAGGLGKRRDELGKFAAHGLWRRRLAHHQCSVFAQQVDRAATTEVDGPIYPLERLEIDDGLHDAVEASIALFDTPRHYDG